MNCEAIIIGGPNGAGKSTLAYEYLHSYPFPYISADLIASQLNPSHPEQACIQAGKAFFEKLYAHLQEQESFIVESILAGRSPLGIIKQLKAAGYLIRIAYVFLDTPELCVRRVHERVQKGGHDVPDEDVIRRFHE